MAHEARDEALGERAQHLLRTLIESYIRGGQPVGSRALSRESGLQLSSATIRNVMADLEELGFVASPHTSSGRVPTDKGYRFFVDTLLQLRPLDDAASAEIRRQFEASRDSSTDLIATVSQLLSSATQLAGVVTLPRTRPASAVSAPSASRRSHSSRAGRPPRESRISRGPATCRAICRANTRPSCPSPPVIR